jgi:hypothetical protein
VNGAITPIRRTPRRALITASVFGTEPRSAILAWASSRSASRAVRGVVCQPLAFDLGGAPVLGRRLPGERRPLELRVARRVLVPELAPQGCQFVARGGRRTTQALVLLALLVESRPLLLGQPARAGGMASQALSDPVLEDAAPAGSLSGPGGAVSVVVVISWLTARFSVEV